MADDDTIVSETTEPVTEPVESGQDRDWKALREKAERAEALEGQLRETVFTQVPFDRDESGNLTGIGKAVSKEYSGDLTPDAVQAYASEEYGWQPPTVPTEAEKLTEDLSRVGRVGGVSEPVVTPRNYREAVDQKEAEVPNGTLDPDLLLLKTEWAADQAVKASSPDL